jgi:predicted DCC family thiol-disulfide oxidoreductase YuxK
MTAAATGMAVAPQERAAILVFDADCGFCSAYARWADSRLGDGSSVVAWQRIDDLSSVGLSKQDVECAAWWIDSGQRWAGGDAIARSLMAMHGPWRLLGRLLRLWPISAAARLVYRWVAANRHLMPGGTSACRLG